MSSFCVGVTTSFEVSLDCSLAVSCFGVGVTSTSFLSSVFWAGAITSFFCSTFVAGVSFLTSAFVLGVCCLTSVLASAFCAGAFTSAFASAFWTGAFTSAFGATVLCLTSAFGAVALWATAWLEVCAFAVAFLGVAGLVTLPPLFGFETTSLWTVLAFEGVVTTLPVAPSST